MPESNFFYAVQVKSTPACEKYNKISSHMQFYDLYILE